MKIREVYEIFKNYSWFKCNLNPNSPVVYLFAYNSLRLGRIEEYSPDTLICYYRTGQRNDKEHNLIINDKEDIKILLKYLFLIFDRQYEGKEEITTLEPIYMYGKFLWQIQQFYKKRIPNKELNLR